ncbi:MFS transporter [Alkalicoccobacillus porphyridii]|uniref:MFS transporter n=1 Tax=Alkalicoccobacillus porphyridii TaxID=2597270 RepID=A0A553ZX30_9BACI|nr:MFS transporter [Alkalicoccobacillus porphyridii]TSB45945.1 MFS transporter [Alkalicoccobacillus porphyridii]
MDKYTIKFLKIWTPSYLVFFSYALTIFTMSWFISESPSGGGDVLGVIMAIGNLVSTVVVVLFSGLIDKVNRKNFLLLMQILMFLIILSLLLPYSEWITGFLMVLFMACVVITLESSFSLYGAALETSMADLAPKRWTSNRTALLIQLHPQLARVIAPMVGGALLATGLLKMTSIVAAVSIFISIFFLYIWSSSLLLSDRKLYPTTEKVSFTSLMLDVRGAWSWIVERQLLVFLLVIGIINSLVVPSFYQLLPAFISEMPIGNDNDEVFYGLFSSAYGVGMIVTSLIFIKIAKRTKRPGLASAGFVFLMAIVVFLVTILQNLYFLIASSFVLGILFILLIMFVGGAWLDMTPSSIRVRVFSVRRLITFVSIPLGTVIMGFGGAAIGYMIILRILVGCMMIALLLSIFLLKGWKDRAIRVE